MGKRPKLQEIEERLKKGEAFEITRDQYKRSTGIDTPQDKYYTMNHSAVAKKAAEFGFKIEIEPERLKFVVIKEEKNGKQ